VLGTLINFLAMKRVNTRGINQANKCMLMAAIAYNLKKLIKLSTPKEKAKTVEINVPLDLLFSLLKNCCLDFRMTPPVSN
jgi:hypothetical protein